MIVGADRDAIARAARIIRAGGLVAFPTETVYGLGANAGQGLAVASIFEAKGRPRFNPLIVHVLDLEAAQRFAVFSDTARALASTFWPGPLSLVLPLAAIPGFPVSELVTAGLDTVAIRVPAHPVARALLAEAAVPIAAPSANKSGRVSPTRARHVEADFGQDVFILDGGAAEAGLESAIVTLLPEPTLLRPGAVARDDIEAVLGARLADFQAGKVQSPGQLSSHYAPRAPVRLNAVAALPGEALLAFGPLAPENALNLSPTGDLREAAANLFAYLREIDARAPAGIAVMPVPATGLGEAINDRLRRAAAPRGAAS